MSLNRPSSPKNTIFISGVASYIVDMSDDIINVDTTAGPITIFLPNIQGAGLNLYPKSFCINDTGGVAGTNAITIQGLNGDLINGGVSTQIAKDNTSGIADVCNLNEWLVSKDTDSAVSGIGGSGTINFIPKFTASTIIGDSLMSDNGTTVAIGIASGNASAIFQLDSTTQGFAPPRMDTAARDLIATPMTGLMIYNTDTNLYNYYNGSAWSNIDTDNQSLTDVLTVGNTTANGQTIDALNGSGQLDLRNGGDSIVALTNDAAAFTDSGLYISPDYAALYSTGYTAVHEAGAGAGSTEYTASYISNAQITISNTPNVVSARAGILVGIVNGGYIEAGAAALNKEVGVIVGGNAGRVLDGAHNSVKLGGRAFHVKDTNVAGAENFALHNSSGNLRILLQGTATIDRTQTFQDADGTIALTSDIPGTPSLSAVLAVGNTTGATSISINEGQGVVYNTAAGGPFTGTLTNATLTGNRVWTLPDATGTILLSGSEQNIYNTSSTLTTDRTVTLGEQNLLFSLEDPYDGSSGMFAVAGRGFTTATIPTPIFFQAPSTVPITLRGFNGSPATAAVRITSFGGTLTSGEFHNDGTVILSPEAGATTRSQTVVGNTVASATTRFTIRSGGATSASHIMKGLDSASVQKFGVRSDGLVQVNTPNDTIGSQTMKGVIGLSTDTTLAGTHAGIGWQHTYTPTANGTGISRGLYMTSIKAGTFNSTFNQGIVGWSQNTGTGNLSENLGVYALSSNTAAATITQQYGLVAESTTTTGLSTFTEFGGVEVRFGSVGNATITDMIGVHVNTPTNTTGTTATNTYGVWVRSNTLGTTNNYGFRQDGGNSINIFQGHLTIGGGSAPSGALTVQGAGATSATNLVTFENSGGVDKYIFQDDGRVAFHAGGTASLNATMGAYHQSTGYSFGFTYYGRTGTSTTMGVFNASSGANGTGLDVQFQGSPTGTATAIRGLSWQSTSTTNTGVLGTARNGINFSIGIDGTNPGGEGQAPATYRAAVRGLSASNLSAVSHGGYFGAQWNNATINYNSDYAGVTGYASGSAGLGTSTGDLMGGNFYVTSNNGTGDAMALRVPSTGNVGTIVFGADSPSANASFMEVTGDLEIIGGSNSLIMTDRTNGNRYEAYFDGGTWTTNLLP